MQNMNHGENFKRSRKTNGFVDLYTTNSYDYRYKWSKDMFRISHNSTNALVV